MEEKIISNHIAGIQTEGQCRKESFYVRFTDDDVEDLLHYAFDMGYSLEPETEEYDVQHPLRFKVTSKSDPKKYGWIAKVVEITSMGFEEKFLYGFYRQGAFIVKYPITFNIQSRQMRGVLRRKAETNASLKTYYRTLYGILSLEPEIHPLDFIFSWLYDTNIIYV